MLTIILVEATWQLAGIMPSSEHVNSTGPAGSEAGKAYWYQRQNDGKWKEVHTIEGENATDLFGSMVAISGNYAIVGARRFNGTAGSRTGKAYWYQRQNDGKWKEVHTIEGENANDQFGNDVAISGNYAIVGTTSNVAAVSTSGKAYWYQRKNDGKWKEVHSVVGEKASSAFGETVSISGNYAVVGAYDFNGTAGVQAGKAYWYQRQNDGKWKEVHTIEGENDNIQFGISVAISGNYAIVGARRFTGSAGSLSGKAYWYQRQNDGKWKEVHTIEGENAVDLFGVSVAISGNYAIVGADVFPSAGNEGKIYIYQRSY